MVSQLPPSSKRSKGSLFREPLSECEAGIKLLAAFERRARKFSCMEDQILFYKGEPGKFVYFVRAGEVDLILSLSSTRAVGFRGKAGSLIGLPAAFSRGQYSMTAVAYRGAELKVMAREDFCDMVASDSQLSIDVLRILAAETHAARIAILDAGMKRRRRTPAAAMKELLQS
jgi:CRP-like cAMP-binding protein